MNIGDVVTVSLNAKDHCLNTTGWDPRMEEYLGQKAIITGIWNNSCRASFSGREENSFAFPYTCIQEIIIPLQKHRIGVK